MLVMFHVHWAWAESQFDSLEVVDGVFMTPALDVAVEYDDNIFRLDRDTTGSVVTRITPVVEFETGSEGSVFALGYGGDYGFFANSSDDNYDHHTLRVDGDLQGPVVGVTFMGAFSTASDPRGTGPTDALAPAARQSFTGPTKFRDWEADVETTIGGRGTRSQVALGYDLLDRSYRNVRDATRARDRQQHTFRLGYDFMLTGTTRALVRVQRRLVDYDFAPTGEAPLDSKEVRVTAGLRWDGHQGTTGSVQLGWQQKDFDDGLRSDMEGFTWDVGVAWEATPRATLGLHSRRDFAEPYNVGSGIEVTRAGALWIHAWRDGLRTRTEVEYVEERFRDLDRVDDRYRVEFSVEHDLQRWLTVGAGVGLSSRDSVVAAADYDRRVGFVQITMTL